MSRFFRPLILTVVIVLTISNFAQSQLVINEFDYDQQGTDSSEFIEIKNIGFVGTDLSNYNLVLINGANGNAAIYNAFILPATTLMSGEYFVICGNTNKTPNCDMDVTPDVNLIQNGMPDAIAITDSSGIVDVVSYEGDVISPYLEGSGVGIQDFASVENLGISRYPDGVDTDMNNIDFSRRCISPGNANLMSDTLCLLTTSVLTEESKSPTILMFPNPANDLVYFYSADLRNTYVLLFDMQGRICMEQNINGVLNGTINVSNLSHGAYNLQIRHQSGIINRRLIVSH